MTRTIRVLVAVVIILCAAAWVPDAIQAQGADLVAEAREALSAERIDDAIGLLERAVMADANDPAALAWLGSAQVRKAGKVPLLEAPGWVSRGFKTLDGAVARFPDAFIVYFVRGVTAARVPDLFGKAPVAVKDLNLVIAMREKNPGAVPDAVMPSTYFSLGLAYKKSSQTAEARSAWEKGRKLYPSAPEAEAIAKELQDL